MSFASHMAAIFAAQGAPAVYRSPADEVTALFVMRPSRPLRFGATDVVVDGHCFDVLRDDVTPEVGGVLTVDGVDYPIDAPPIPFPQAGTRFTADPERLRWRLLCSWGSALFYRAVALHRCKVASAAALGAMSISVDSLPSGFDHVNAGDIFGGGLYTITADTDATGDIGGFSSGESEIGQRMIANIPFSPGLKAAYAAGASIEIAHHLDTPCRGTVEYLDASVEPAPGVRQFNATATILAGTLPFRPIVANRLIDNGRVMTIEEVGRDPEAVTWVLYLSG